MPTANDRLADAEVGHAIDLTHYSNGTVRRMLALLNRTDADLWAQLQRVLGDMDPASFTVDRLESLLGSVRTLNRQLYEQLLIALQTEIEGLAASEVDFQRASFADVVPAQIRVASVSSPQVYAAALARPMQGRLLREWAASIEAGRMTRIRDSLRMGFVEGKTVDQMVRELRGTRAKQYQDGIIEIDRTHAESVVRTAISHTAAVARDQMYEANADLVKGVVWRATLDNKTSQMCRIRDGKEYTLTTHKPIGHSIPWGAGPGRLHWNCRSTSSPVLKSWEELGGVSGPEFTPAQRASMDGAVPADITYADWLKKQSAARQDEILGPTRGALYRRGGLAIEQFSNDKGKTLNLDQLRQRHVTAFERAGL